VNRRRWDIALLLTAGLLLAVLAQFYFTYRREFYRDGIFFYVLALLFVLWAWRRERRAGVARQAAPAPPHRRRDLRRLSIAVGAGLTVLAGWLASRQSPDRDFTPLLLLWLVGLAYFMLPFLLPLPPGWWRQKMDWLRNRRGDLARLALLLAAALAVRAVDLAHIPQNFSGDEGTQALAGLRLLGPPLGNPFSTGWYSVPTMSFFAYGLSMRLFGATVAGARALSALIGTATVLTTFLLARELWGKRVAWLAAALLAFGHYHLHFSRLASNQIADPLFITLVLWLLARGLRTGRLANFVLSGAVVGAAWYGYFGGRLVLLVLAAFVVWRALVEHGFLRRNWRGLLWLGAAAVVVMVPLLFHYLAHPAELTSRYNQVSIFASGWLAREQQITGRSALSLLWQQFWKSATAFHYTLDPTFWYHADIPLLDVVSGVLMLVGMGWTVVRWRARGSDLLLLWFWLALITGWVMTENPPSSQRMTVAAPAAALLAALGLDGLLVVGRQLVGGRLALWSTIAAGLVGLAVALNLGYYFLDYAPTRTYGNPTAEVSDRLCDLLEAREAVPPVYFDGVPFMYWDFGSTAFRLRHVVGRDFTPEEGMGGVDVSRGALFVVLAEKGADLPMVQQAFPGGAVQEVFSDADGRLLFTLYELPPGP